MGAASFENIGKGETAEEAFRAAVSQAQYDYGHAGYSGTLAEKGDYVSIPLPDDADASEYANKLMDDGDKRIDDKWGPAGVIALGDGEWLIFGWASS